MNLPRPGQKIASTLSYSDVDTLCTKNERLRWVIIDEVRMLSDELLGLFEDFLSTAATKSKFRDRHVNKKNIFGGYSLMLFGYWWQLPPIPDIAALTRPQTTRNIASDVSSRLDVDMDRKTRDNEQHTTDQPNVTKKKESVRSGRAKRVLEMFWNDDPDALNYLVELSEQKRVKDPWYNSLLMQCRNGELSKEAYAFLHGLPTHHCGSWWIECIDDDSSEEHTCEKCGRLSGFRYGMAKKGSGWAAMQALECETC